MKLIMENFRKYLLNEAKLETANPVFDNEDFWDDWTDIQATLWDERGKDAVRLSGDELPHDATDADSGTTQYLKLYANLFHQLEKKWGVSEKEISDHIEEKALYNTMAANKVGDR
jgi:hypothetical protein